MKKVQRTPEQIREHYEIEKRLAGRLRSSTRGERQGLYTSLYDELFRAVPHHPQLIKKSSPKGSVRKAARKVSHLRALLKNDTVFLEVGAGDCALSFEAADLVKTVYAVDVSEKITGDLPQPPNFRLILSDGTSIPVPAGSVDVAYSNQLMEHLHPDDALEQLRNIYNALAPGGIYICITPNRLSGPHDISKYFDTVATGFHLKEYTATELEHLFRATGFSKVRIFVISSWMRVFLPLFPLKLGEKVLKRLPRPLRRRLVSVRPAARVLSIRLAGIK